MKKDALYGPPKEIFQEKYEKEEKIKKKNKKAESDDDSDDEDDLYAAFGSDEDKEDANAYHQSRLRRYEVQKMRYYYAIVHCNNSKTACALYDEYNGFEFENSNLRLMMSLVPNDVEFN